MKLSNLAKNALALVWFILKPIIALLLPIACMTIVAGLLTLPWILICGRFFPDYPEWVNFIMVVLGAAGMFLGLELSLKIFDSQLFESDL